MPRRPSNSVRFTGASGVVITDTEHQLLTSVVGPYYGTAVSTCLSAASVVPGGRRIDVNHPALDELIEAIGCEVHGYMKLDDERTGRASSRPTRGTTAHHLMAVYQRIEAYRA